MIRIRDPEPGPVLDYLREHFSYSPPHRGLTYKKATARNTQSRLGQRVGSVHPFGYVAVKIRGRLFREHRLVFLLLNGRWPAGELDHANGDNADNRIENLRECDRSENCANRRRWGVTSDYRGVHLHKKTGKYQAAIRVNGKTKYLGLFDDQIEAAVAYDREAKQAFGPFVQLNFKEEA